MGKVVAAQPRQLFPGIHSGTELADSYGPIQGQEGAFPSSRHLHHNPPLALSSFQLQLKRHWAPPSQELGVDICRFQGCLP